MAAEFDREPNTPGQRKSDDPLTPAEHVDKTSARKEMAARQEMAALWVQSQSIVSAFVTANVVDRQHAEDVIQEVAKAVAEKFGSFDQDRRFTPWVLGIARNQLLKYYRKRASDRVVLSEAALECFGQAMAKMEDTSEDRREALRNCLPQIVGRSRHVLDLRYGRGLGIKEIGNDLGIAASTVSVMLFRVRMKLLECIQRHLGQSPS